jgi:hypothetical protein
MGQTHSRKSNATANGVVVAVILLGIARVAFAAPTGNPYVAPALRLYQSLEFEEALRTIERAREWPSNTTEDVVQVALLEGIIAGQLNRADQALAAFKRGLAVAPDAALPLRVSPKVADLFARAKSELPPAPTLPAPSLPQAPAPEPTPPPVEPPPKSAPTVETARPEAPQGPPIGFVGGALGFVDVAGKSVGAEVLLGAALGSHELTLRGTVGRTPAIGLGASFGLRLGPITATAAAVGHYLPGPSAWGGGPTLGIRLGGDRGFGLRASTTLELFATSEQYRNLAVVLALGLDWRS